MKTVIPSLLIAVLLLFSISILTSCKGWSHERIRECGYFSTFQTDTTLTPGYVIATFYYSRPQHGTEFQDVKIAKTDWDSIIQFADKEGRIGGICGMVNVAERNIITDTMFLEKQ